MTFSIVARDPLTGALGVATATAGPSVGALVVHGDAGVGAIATQAMTNPLLGLHGLTLLRKGLTAHQTLAKLLEQDNECERRQVMIIDRRGDVAHWSGTFCGEFAGVVQQGECVVGGNLLANTETLNAMLAGFNQPETRFEMRLLAALKQGATAGGDRRGMKSAALKIWHDREYASVDARVDWSDTPLTALEEILLHQQAASYADFFARIPKGECP